MPKLHQIVAVHKDVASKAGKRLSELGRLIQHTDMFTGQIRTNRQLDDSVPALPDESTKVQENIPNVVSQVADVMARYFDITATRDFGTIGARADVKLDGVTLVEQAPVDFLLFLEKQVAELTEFANRIPTLSSAETWHAEGDGTYRAEAKVTHQKVKMPHVTTKWQPPSPDYRQEAQTEVYYTDDLVGYWDTIKRSGAIPVGDKADLLKRLTMLSHAVKFAREEANSIAIDNVHVGRQIVDYLFGPIGLTSEGHRE